MPTKIEWAEETWNPITGCSPISEGCANCYAKRMSKRLAGRCGYPEGEPFRVTLHPDKLDQPMKWKKPRMIFVCSMGDLFHEDVPDTDIEDIFATMSMCPQHTFMLLTKRPDRVLHWFSHFRADSPTETVRAQVWRSRWSIYKTQKHFEWPLPNVWLGVTAENQARADDRLPILMQIPAAKRFVSVEPMLGPVDLTDLPISTDYVFRGHRFNALSDIDAKLDWVICGGETGPGARPMHPYWVRSLRDQCVTAGVPFFFKSWGDWAPGKLFDPYPRNKCQFINLDKSGLTSDSLLMRKVGKKYAGRQLDGQTWEQRP